MAINKNENSIEKENEASTIDQILDPNNTDNIVLYNAQGEPVEFEQVAVIPYDEELYVLLRPLKTWKGVKDDEAIVFKVVEDEEEMEFYLDIETDEETINTVFAEYTKLFEKK